MKRNTILKLTCLLTALVLFNSSCKKWLDINDDPNSLSMDNTKIEYNLTSSQYTIAYVLGNRYQELGGFLSQYWTQLPSATQYYDYDRYSLDGADADREWSQLYAGALRDLKFVVDQGSTSGDSSYVAIAKFLQAYTYQLISDVHGDIPFSEALQAQDGILSPKYDAQADVYDGCLKMIQDGLAMVPVNPDAKKPSSDDIIFGGDMDLWKQFAYTLELKLAVRQSGVRPSVAQQILTDLSNDPDASFLQTNAAVSFFDKIGNKNPLFTSIQGIGVDNNVASKTISTVLNGWNDPRAPFMFDESTFGAAGINGITQGAAAAGGFPSNAPRSTAATTIIGPTVPVILISASESLFLQAEAAEMMAPGSGQDSYEEAVVASMEYCGVDTTGLGLFEDANYSWDSTTNHMELIATQKWVSMCGIQNMEAWCEIRRTGYPVLTPSLASQLATGALPERIPYVNGEQNANANFPGQAPITKKLWWAKP